MGKFLLIEYKYTKINNNDDKTDNIQVVNDLVIIQSPPQHKAFAAEIMLKKLVKDWANSNFDTKLLLDTHSQIFKKIVDCYPRKDIEGWGFDVTNLNQEQIESLFLKKIKFVSKKNLESGFDNDQDLKLEDCDLLELLKAEPIQPKPDDGLPKPPPPTSGDDEIDLLAALTNCLESYEQALMVCKSLSLSDIYKFLKQLNELKRDPEDVLNEWMADKFAEYKARKGSANYARDVLGLHAKTNNTHHTHQPND